MAEGNADMENGFGIPLLLYLGKLKKMTGEQAKEADCLLVRCMKWIEGMDEMYGSGW